MAISRGHKAHRQHGARQRMIDWSEARVDDPAIISTRTYGLW